mmetsp:Transcript_29164/g.52146  ORF Transcript_29164/g.52146 Transcript_29164/m.52146 type:complete len:235 (-) Transcript_29164:694-1398(-)
MKSLFQVLSLWRIQAGASPRSEAVAAGDRDVPELVVSAEAGSRNAVRVSRGTTRSRCKVGYAVGVAHPCPRTLHVTIVIQGHVVRPPAGVDHEEVHLLVQVRKSRGSTDGRARQGKRPGPRPPTLTVRVGFRPPESIVSSDNNEEGLFVVGVTRCGWCCARLNAAPQRAPLPGRGTVDDLMRVRLTVSADAQNVKPALHGRYGGGGSALATRDLRPLRGIAPTTTAPAAATTGN